MPHTFRNSRGLNSINHAFHCLRIHQYTHCHRSNHQSYPRRVAIKRTFESSPDIQAPPGSQSWTIFSKVCSSPACELFVAMMSALVKCVLICLDSQLLLAVQLVLVEVLVFLSVEVVAWWWHCNLHFHAMIRLRFFAHSCLVNIVNVVR